VTAQDVHEALSGRLGDSGALFSDDQLWRFLLWRFFPPRLCGPVDVDPMERTMPVVTARRRLLNLLMLNPSTADAKKDDPTVAKGGRLAHAWGYDGIVVTNLSAWRSTDPKALYTAGYATMNLSWPWGTPDNDTAILTAAKLCDLTICAWGVHGALGGRGASVAAMLRGATRLKRNEAEIERGVNLCYLRLTKDGHPEHPLYIPMNTVPKPWEAIS
jgi:hypothetical protein